MKFKRFLSVLLALTMVLSYVPFGAFATETGDETPIVSEETPSEPSETPSETPEGEAEIEQIADEPTVTTVANEAELAAALAIGGDVVLGASFEVSAPAIIPEGVTATLDLAGFGITAGNTVYALNNRGTLTIKDSVGTGFVTARGIYNGYGADGNGIPSAKLTIESGTYNAIGTNGGAAVFNYGEAVINSGKFTSIGSYSLNNQAGAKMTVNNGVVATGGMYISGAEVTFNGGDISGTRSGCHVVYAWNAVLNIYGGNFYNYNSGNATVMAAGTSKANIYGGTFGIKDGRVPGNGSTWKLPSPQDYT